MSKDHIIAAQLSSVHSPVEKLEPGSVLNYLEPMINEVPLDILILGWEEKKDLFTTLTEKSTRLSKEVFLWYPFLSDYPQFDHSHLVVNVEAGRSVGWDGYDGTGINETFKQACPNNPEAIDTSLKHLERLLTQYDFDGVFVDKIRFPSMANGLRDVFTCFCPFCKQKAAEDDLDLNDVIAALEKGGKVERTGTGCVIPPGGEWLEELVSDQPLMQQFIRFRADSINKVVAKIKNKMARIEKKMSLDVFSPCLAPLVGQDFDYMDQQAVWVKPMIYRFGNGPSSLRSEIPALIHELGGYLGYTDELTMEWVGKNAESLKNVTIADIERVAPLNLLKTETFKATKLFQNTPVYLGLETVSIPGVMSISPRNVEEIIENGEEAGVQGYVLSWDLLHTPIENVLPLRELIR